MPRVKRVRQGTSAFCVIRSLVDRTPRTRSACSRSFRCHHRISPLLIGRHLDSRHAGRSRSNRIEIDVPGGQVETSQAKNVVVNNGIRPNEYRSVLSGRIDQIEIGAEMHVLHPGRIRPRQVDVIHHFEVAGLKDADLLPNWYRYLPSGETSSAPTP